MVLELKVIQLVLFCLYCVGFLCSPSSEAQGMVTSSAAVSESCWWSVSPVAMVSLIRGIEIYIPKSTGYT